jgi:hypothetical protein
LISSKALSAPCIRSPNSSAAIKAVGEAAHLGVALRISGYLLAGAFLLAVAYWYRATADLASAGRA